MEWGHIIQGIESAQQRNSTYYERQKEYDTFYLKFLLSLVLLFCIMLLFIDHIIIYVTTVIGPPQGQTVSLSSAFPAPNTVPVVNNC